MYTVLTDVSFVSSSLSIGIKSPGVSDWRNWKKRFSSSSWLESINSLRNSFNVAVSSKYTPFQYSVLMKLSLSLPG